MKGAIIQPYLFPYLPYLSLVSNVDIFVSLVDVNLNKRSLINRNTVSLGGHEMSFVLPIVKKSQNKLISEHFYEAAAWQPFWSKLIEFCSLSSLRDASSGKVFELLLKLSSSQDLNVGSLNTTSLVGLLRCLSFNVPRVISSPDIRSSISSSLSGTPAIIGMCLELGITHYINLPGGVSLYEPYRDTFSDNGIRLSYLDLDRYKSWSPSYCFFSSLSWVLSDSFQFNSLPLFLQH